MARILIRKRAAAQVFGSFLGRSAGGAALRIGDLGGHPSHVQCHGGGSGPGGETSDRTALAEDTGREVDIHLSGDGTGGGGVLDDGGIHQAAP